MKKVQELIKKLESFCSELDGYYVGIHPQHFTLYESSDNYPEFSAASEEDFISRLERKIEYAERNCEVIKDREITITSVTHKGITFSNEYFMYSYHEPDCSEYNYADWEQLDDLARGYTFKGKLLFEPVPGAGFRFGDSRRMFFVPCYSEQNGYYSCNIDIYIRNRYHDKFLMLSTRCDCVDD